MITVFINSTQKQKLKIFLVNAKKYKLWLPKSSILGSFSWHIFVCSLFESLTIITFKYFSKSWLTPKLRSYKLPLTSLKLLSHYLSNWKLHETWKFSQSMGDTETPQVSIPAFIDHFCLRLLNLATVYFENYANDKTTYTTNQVCDQITGGTMPSTIELYSSKPKNHPS